MNTHEPPTYGGWRRARAVGLFGLGLGQTMTVLAATTVALITASVSAARLLVVGPLCLVVIVGNLAQWDGVTVAQALVQRLRWTVGNARGRTTYRGAVLSAERHAWQLPGVLAPTVLLSVDDGQGDGYGVVWHRRLRTMTVTLHCAAQSTWLADPDAAAAWVYTWGGWLAGLGRVPTVRWVAITVDTAPDSGTRLADYIAARIAPDGPPAAVQILQQLVAAAPQAAADVHTNVSITFEPALSPARPRTVQNWLGEVDRALPGLQDGLTGCGLTVLGRASAAEIAGIVRRCFDPTARADVTRLLAADTAAAAELLDWGSAGPVAAQEYPDRYEHDGATSISWAWQDAPRQPVTHHVLARLLAPGDHAKRVTLLYRPLSTARAAAEVEQQVNAAQFRAAYRRARKLDPTARDVADHEQAVQAAREEALGAGVGHVSLWVTTTVLDEDELGRAVADIESRAETSKLRLRRLWRSQAAGFAATLPVGICLPALAKHLGDTSRWSTKTD
ncbi:SCO6880 family protein [Dactylosporangium sp. AC04546]|uniref:SCO6880 family protein n=1 Tax=Dactylosporangium sp. AC04546 TaxID=2862460 RepID=UPI001EE01F0E|nr:SCO6880 family protein [Dactylosporangium sp. AC04546]WVK80438.1 SCO6880 family protein [Dactylosporangium sp. AC04546]